MGISQLGVTILVYLQLYFVRLCNLYYIQHYHTTTKWVKWVDVDQAGKVFPSPKGAHGPIPINVVKNRGGGGNPSSTILFYLMCHRKLNLVALGSTWVPGSSTSAFGCPLHLSVSSLPLTFPTSFLFLSISQGGFVCFFFSSYVHPSILTY